MTDLQNGRSCATIGEDRDNCRQLTQLSYEIPSGFSLSPTTDKNQVMMKSRKRAQKAQLCTESRNSALDSI